MELVKKFIIANRSKMKTGKIVNSTDIVDILEYLSNYIL